MEITVEKIVTAHRALSFVQDKMPAKLAYTFQRNLRLLRPDAETAEGQRVELVKKYGEQNKDGGYAVIPDKMKEFTEELNELYAVSHELDIRTIPFKDICFDISPVVLADLIETGIVLDEEASGENVPDTVK